MQVFEVSPFCAVALSSPGRSLDAGIERQRERIISACPPDRLWYNRDMIQIEIDGSTYARDENGNLVLLRGARLNDPCKSHGEGSGLTDLAKAFLARQPRDLNGECGSVIPRAPVIGPAHLASSDTNP